MTVVMARQWGNRIIMVSDTMISDRNAPRSDIIPGQLKTIVLTHTLSVAYAGRVHKALPTIREARRTARQGAALPDVVEYLRRATIENNGDVDFLVASHYEEPILSKIWRGQLATGANQYWIGDPSAASAIQRAIELQPIPESGEEDAKEEWRFRLAFTDVIRESTFPGVGGFSFCLLGSPHGHCYQDETGFFAWDTVNVSNIDTPEYRCFQKTGTTHYQYNTIAPQQRGVGITGAFLLQVELGFIYSPLQSDSVLWRPGITLQDIFSEVNQMAADLIGNTS